MLYFRSSNNCVTFEGDEFNPSDCAAVGYAIKKYVECNTHEVDDPKSDIGKDQVLHCHFNSCIITVEGAKALFQEVMNCQLKLTLQ